MSISLYLNCFFISLLGLILSLLMVVKSQMTKAKLANVIFDWKLFFKTDIWISIAGTLVMVGMELILLAPFIKRYPSFADDTLLTLIIFAASGYLGSDLASRFFSVVNSRINSAIDFKSTQSDQLNGTLDAPTPATKPQKQS
jgi:hypothetical protein